MHCNHQDCQSLSDEALIQRTLADKNAFACVIHRYQDKIKRYVRRLTAVSSEELDDIVQDIFINAYIHLRSFKPDLKFSSWLYRIAHNQTITAFRKRKSRPQAIQGEDADFIMETVPSSLDIAAELDQQYVREHVMGVMKDLDVKYREVLMLRYFEEKSYEEISDIIRKPPGTVATLINRAKKQCKKSLEKSYYARAKS